MSWDPDLYLRYAGYRRRPFLDLIAQIDVPEPRQVVDLGCGTGEFTKLLATRWPGADVVGIDSSPQMVAKAATGPGEPRIRLGDIAAFDPAGAFDSGAIDVIVSNAALQWVPGHLELVRRWAGQVPPGGAIAFQVPGNFGAPSHTLMRELADSPRWAPRLAGVLRSAIAVAEPVEYAAALRDAGLTVDAWESTYYQLLAGDDPVLDWVRGTGLRPVLDVLDPEETIAFEDEYRAALRVAYPPGPHGTVLPYRRIFAVGHRPGGPGNRLPGPT